MSEEASAAGPVARSGRAPRELMRERGEGRQRVTNIELFFDLVYVFAVTQLSHYLIDPGHRTVAGALQAAVLLAMVWQLWAYTTWVTNWLDPDRIPVRLLLLGLTLASLVMSAALPAALPAKEAWVEGGDPNALDAPSDREASSEAAA